MPAMPYIPTMRTSIISQLSLFTSLDYIVDNVFETLVMILFLFFDEKILMDKDLTNTIRKIAIIIFKTNINNIFREI